MGKLELKIEKPVVSILLLFFISGIYYAWTNSVTSDEPTYITTGYINLHFNDYFFNNEHAPFPKQLAGLPLLFLKPVFPINLYKASTHPGDIIKIYDAFLFESGNNLDIMLLLSRMPNILISVLLGLFIFLYSKELNGSMAGIVSLALFVFSPTFLAHSPLATLDSTVSAFYFITIYFFMMYVETKRNLYLSLTGIFLGIALISKFSALILIPVLCVLIIIYIFSEGGSNISSLKSYIFFLPLLLFVCSYKNSFWLMFPIIAAYLFFGLFFRKNPISGKLRYAAILLLIILTIAFTVTILDYTNFKWFPFHGATKAYFKGFSCFRCRSAGGDHTFILDKNMQNGRWYYFPLAMIFKEPFAFLAILLLGLAALFSKKEGIMSKSLLLLPPIAYILVAMFINKVNIGIRLILPVYPFLFVIGGYSVLLAKRSKAMICALALLLLVLAVDVSLAYPSHISYFNRLIGGTDEGYKFLSDSNLGWGQDWKRAKEYLNKNKIDNVAIRAAFGADKNCDYYKITHRPLIQQEFIVPQKGYYIIEANELASGDIKWLRKVRPICRIGGSLLLYNITDKDINNLRAD